MVSILTLSFAVILLVLVKWVSALKSFVHLFRLGCRLPGPPALPILGNTLQCMAPPDKMLQALGPLIAPYDSICRFWISHKLFVAVKDPDDVKTLLSHKDTLNRGLFYEFLGLFMALGILTAPADLALKVRRELQPMFNRVTLTSFMDYFVAGGEKLCHFFEARTSGGEFDLHEDIIKITIEVVMRISVQDDLNHWTDKDFACLGAEVEEISDGIADRFFKPWLYFNWFYELTDVYKRSKKACNHVKMQILEFVELKRQRLLELQNDQLVQQDVKEAKYRRMKNGFIEHLLMVEGGKYFADDVLIVDNVLTIFLGAFETTAISLSYTLVLLGIHQDVQQKVLEELNEIFQDSERPPTYDDLKKMVYLEQVMKESLRLFPPALAICREVSQDLQLGKHVIPAGAYCIIPIVVMHRDSRYWKNPLEFDPDRFAPGAVIHPNAFLPFSSGPRSCIGYKYGDMLLKTILSTTLRQYHVTTSLKMSDLKVNNRIALRTDGLKIQVRKRAC